MRHSSPVISNAWLLCLSAAFATSCSSSSDANHPGSAGQAGAPSADSVAAGGLSAVTTGGSATALGGHGSLGGATSSANAGSASAPARCSQVSGAVAKELVANGALLLDVREPNEFTAGALPGAINFPVGDMTSAPTVELDLSRSIVNYCSTGTRSAEATKKLCDAGYNAYNLGAKWNWPL